MPSYFSLAIIRFIACRWRRRISRDVCVYAVHDARVIKREYFTPSSSARVRYMSATQSVFIICFFFLAHKRRLPVCARARFGMFPACDKTRRFYNTNRVEAFASVRWHVFGVYATADLRLIGTDVIYDTYRCMTRSTKNHTRTRRFKN